MVIRNHYASLDPAQRGWMDDVPSYMPPIALGDAVRAASVGVVHASARPDFAVGDWVMGMNAIEDFSVAQPGSLPTKIDIARVPSPTNYLSAIGVTGLTAYFGLLNHGQPKAGETMLVSGAAGAVGSVVGQIGKIMGCRVVGIAGGGTKCDRLRREYGFDAAIDYRGKSADRLAAEIAGVVPEGADIVFENVGGTILDAELMNIAQNARIILCGLISEYNHPEPAGARNLRQIFIKSATLEGFLFVEHTSQFAEAAAEIGEWIADGKLRVDEDVQAGLENSYAAFMRLFSGENSGKLILKII
ncbi:NADP-dependent oxidoreductase [Flavisphingomonas formosensis]|uniref:NADP-dependent oxidoreductase n=1 Tax=Flavisphingomonas formosensis TaxID=861534 RepID=UPI0012FAF40C|nr:NADP-dependent oxidoreductase [Sphingomonas formosensis]